ncbi:MAG: TSUP family transporter [Desulfamplus sp.]|nr:TSUP family transporter [Desulfamplus sp.]
MKRYLIIIFTLLLTFMARGTTCNAVAYTGDNLLLDLQESISHAVAKVRPSVVSVRAQKKQHAPGGGANDFVWFQSIGSGLIVDGRGYILTNRHVINDAENIEVSLWSGTDNKFAAKIMDEDHGLDLALLKIDSNRTFPVAELGNSDTVKIGSYIVSIGSPFGFNHSVSLGIVSDLHREMVIDGVTYKDMIQTDAVINEGNSGGPVIDIYGRVIGVGTAIYAPEGTYRGVGFAIPVNRTKHFFTRVTGALVTAAATTKAQPLPQPTRPKEPVNLNKKMPNDAIHQKFSDCTTCHTIKQKLVVSMKSPMTHPPVGSCDVCHILTNDPVTSGPVPVAATTPMATFPMNRVPAESFNTMAGSPQTIAMQAGRGNTLVQQNLDGTSTGASKAFSTLDETFSDLFKSIILKLGLMTFVASIIFSMLGLGGGFVYVPLLLSCQIDFYTAASTSLMMITISQLSALYTFSKSGLVDLKLAGVLEPPTMVGAFIGGMVAHHFNADALSIMFSCTLFIASYTMMQNSKIASSAEGSTDRRRILLSPFGWEHEFRGRAVKIDLGLTIPITLVTGFFGGLLGLAASWIKIPVMVLMLNIPMKIAIATASIMVPLTALSGFLGHSLAGNFDIRLAITLSLITAVGAQIGSRVSRGSNSNLLRFIFAFVLSVVGVWMILRVF